MGIRYTVINLEDYIKKEKEESNEVAKYSQRKLNKIKDNADTLEILIRALKVGLFARESSKSWYIIDVPFWPKFEDAEKCVYIYVCILFVINYILVEFTKRKQLSKKTERTRSGTTKGGGYGAKDQRYPRSFTGFLYIGKP